jgi:hypothetical protein
VLLRRVASCLKSADEFKSINNNLGEIRTEIASKVKNLESVLSTHINNSCQL